MNRIPITFFDDTFARTISIKRMSMHDLRDLIVTTNAPEKASLKLLKLAKFNDTRSANNSYRYNDNVRAISGVELDYDDEEISVETAIEKIKAANLRSLIYTSPSHTNEKPRWRILLPTSTGLPPAIRPGLVARVNGILGGIISDESFVLSQPFYFGKVGDNPDHKAVIVDGDFVDLRDDLDEGALGKAGKSKTNGGDAAYIDDAKYMEDIRSGAAYHIPLLSLSARRIGGGMNPEEVAGVLEALLNQSSGPRDKRWHAAVDSIPKLVDTAVKKYGEEGDAMILDPSDPMRSARKLVADKFITDEMRTLHRHRGAFWSWTGNYFLLADDEVIGSNIWSFLEKAKRAALH